MTGVRVLPNPNYGTSAGGWYDARRFLITFQRSGARTFGFAKNAGGECPPIFFLDGQYVGNAVQVDVDRFLDPESIEAVEAYGGVGIIPAEFNRPGAACGVIAFWTR